MMNLISGCCLFRDENDLVPQVVQAVLSIPTSAHIAVRYTTLQLIGELCEWIDKHPQVIGKFILCYYTSLCPDDPKFGQTTCTSNR